MPASDPRLEAWRALLQTRAECLRRIEDDLDRDDHVPLEQYDVLLELRHAPRGRLRLSDLAERVVLTRSGVSRLVARMEAADLVRRRRDEEDGRGRWAELAPAGVAALRRTWPAYRRAIRRHFGAHVTPAEARRLAAVLDRVRERTREG